MSHLRPCPGCDRHVRADVTLCPFCDATLTADSASPPLPAARLGRAAQMAFGAAAVAASLSVASCTKNPPGDDSGNVVQPYGAPPDRTNIAQPYGAPPDLKPVLDAAASANETSASTALAGASADAGHEVGKADAGKAKPPPTATATATTTTTVSPRDWGNHAKPYGAPPADGLGELV